MYTLNYPLTLKTPGQSLSIKRNIQNKYSEIRIPLEKNRRKKEEEKVKNSVYI